MRAGTRWRARMLVWLQVNQSDRPCAPVPEREAYNGAALWLTRLIQWYDANFSEQQQQQVAVARSALRNRRQACALSDGSLHTQSSSPPTQGSMPSHQQQPTRHQIQQQGDYVNPPLFGPPSHGAPFPLAHVGTQQPFLQPPLQQSTPQQLSQPTSNAELLQILIQQQFLIQQQLLQQQQVMIPRIGHPQATPFTPSSTISSGAEVHHHHQHHHQQQQQHFPLPPHLPLHHLPNATVPHVPSQQSASGQHSNNSA